MGRISRRNEPPEKPQPVLLSAHISSLSELHYTAAIPKLAELVPGLVASLSYTGERLVHHEAYQGSANLNFLARTWMRMGSFCRAEGASLHLRLQQNELKNAFERLYERTQSELNEARFAGVFAGFREFSIACGHCVGHPWVAIPEGTGHISGAFYFEDKEYESIWGDERCCGKWTGMSGEGEMRRMTTWKKAKEEQVREAIERGID